MPGAIPFSFNIQTCLHPCQKKTEASKWKNFSDGYYTAIAFNLAGDVLEIFKYISRSSPSSTVSACVLWFTLIENMSGFENWPQRTVRKN